MRRLSDLNWVGFANFSYKQFHKATLGGGRCVFLPALVGSTAALDRHSTALVSILSAPAAVGLLLSPSFPPFCLRALTNTRARYGVMISLTTLLELNTYFSASTLEKKRSNWRSLTITEYFYSKVSLKYGSFPSLTRRENNN